MSPATLSLQRRLDEARSMPYTYLRLRSRGTRRLRKTRSSPRRPTRTEHKNAGALHPLGVIALHKIRPRNYTPHTIATEPFDGLFVRAQPAPGALSAAGARRTSTYISRAPISRNNSRAFAVDAGPGRGGRGLETISISFIVAPRRRRRRWRRLRVRTRAGGV